MWLHKYPVGRHGDEGKGRCGYTSTQWGGMVVRGRVSVATQVPSGEAWW